MQISAASALENIQKGIVSTGYLLFGKQLYWRDRIHEALRKSFGDGAAGMGIAEFDLRQDPLGRVLDEARSLNLLAPRQLLFVRNAQALDARRRRGTQRAATGDTQLTPSDDLSAYLLQPNPSTTIVFEMMDVNLESDDWREREKAKARLAAFEDLCDVILLVSPNFRAAMELLRQEAAALGRKISPAAAEQLLTVFDKDMGRIRMELEKICLYNPEKESVDLEDLEPMVPALAGKAGTTLAEAIGAGDKKKALEILEELERSGKYLPLVISEVARYLRQLIVLKENRARDTRQAGKVLWSAKLPAPPNVLPALLGQGRKMSGAQLLRGLQLAFEADLALRSSPPRARIVLEQFILQLFRSRPSTASRV